MAVFDMGGMQTVHMRRALAAENTWIPHTAAVVRNAAGVADPVLTTMLAAIGTDGFYMNPGDAVEVWFEGLAASTGCCVQGWNAITSAWDDRFTWDPTSGEKSKIIQGITGAFRAGVKTGGFNAADAALAVNLRFIGSWNR